jgi:ATP-dependent RNA helicase DHX8/PRP22
VKRQSTRRGKPTEDYLDVARMLMARYDAALQAVRLLRAANPDDAHGKITVVEEERTACCFVAAVLNEMLASPPTDVETAVSLLNDLLPQLYGTGASAASADAWMLSPRCLADACALIHAAMSVDLAHAVRHGAEVLALEEERRRTEESAKQRAAAAWGTRGPGIALNSEDKFVIDQLLRGGVDELLRERMPEREEDYDFDAMEVEVADLEPRFLRGRIPRKRTTSLVMEARRVQNEAVFSQNPAGNTRGGRGAAAGGRGGSRGGGFAALSGAEETYGSSMEAAAARQQEYARERRELRARKRRMDRDAVAPGAGEDATERTTRDAAGFMATELDEHVEEQGVRSKADLPPGALPPWLRPKGAGGPSSSREERDTIAWGIRQSADIQSQRARLPIAQHKDHILRVIDSQPITVLVGETGSGKTTQIAQYLAEAGYGKRGLIGCTQPRRVAATSLAERVAIEYGCRLGEEVGYVVRFKDMTSKLTIIKYLTDGMLLREALGDDSFSAYSVIILDEAHERSLNTDVLFGLVKAAAARRGGDLKVIVTSATLDTEKFCEYFGTKEPLVIPGRTHPVTFEYTEAPVEDYIEETLHTVMTIHLTLPAGDILCFLTGQDEIESVAERLHQWTTSEDLEGMPPLIITVIFGALPQENQSTVFDKTPKGSRKVVLATNIAETSITINDLYYVVDCGFCKQNIFDPKTGVDSLQIVPISQQQAKQRAGRAGRTGPGKCYRLYTAGQFDELPAASVPEIQRTNLINVVLTLKATGVPDLLTFDFLDPPKAETLVLALEKLFYLGALDADGVLTKLGSRMSELPLEPSQCKTLLIALDMGCASTVLTVVSMLSTQSVFYRPRDRQEEADLRKARFTAAEGDQLSLLAVYDAWIAAGASAEWCADNFVQHRALRDARDIRTQLERILSRRAAASSAIARGARDADTARAHAVNCLGPEQGNRDPTLVRKALTAGYFFQAAKRTMAGEYKTLVDRRDVSIHPSSTLAHTKPRYVIFHELVRTTKDYMRNAMAIDPRWLTELAPDFYKAPAPGQLTKEQMAERLAPKLRRHEQGNDWRISKVRNRGRR